MKQIRAGYYGRHGCYTRGLQMIGEIQTELQKREREAAKLLRETEAAHVLYGLKIYDKDQLACIQYYMWPMTEREFDRLAKRTRNTVVYALHRR